MCAEERPEEQADRKNQHAKEHGRVEPSPDRPAGHFDWPSWNLFFQRIYGSEQVGYEVDEDGWPLDDGECSGDEYSS